MTRKLIFTSLLAAGLMTAPAFADPDGWFWGRGQMGDWFRGEMWRYGMMGDGPGHMMMGRRFSEHRLEALKSELGITAAQEDVWKTYMTAVQSAADGMRSTHQTMMDRGSFKTLPERLDAQAAMMASRQDVMKTVREATLALYEKLDEAQKKKADDLILGMGMM